MRVLMVEDSRTMRMVLSRAVSEPWPEAQIVEAGSVDQAKEILREEQSVDLILLDCNLPGSNGVELLDHVAADEFHRGTPVVMVSAETETSVIISALRKGARGYITKPFDEAKFHRMLTEHLGTPETEREAGAS